MLVKIEKEVFCELLPYRLAGWELVKRSKFSAFGGTLGNFTVIIVKNKVGIYAGVSKRNPQDKDSNNTGLRIAAVRAWRSVCGEDPGYERQRPVSKREAKYHSAIALVEGTLLER
jgi:hypothetical protein